MKQLRLVLVLLFGGCQLAVAQNTPWTLTDFIGIQTNATPIAPLHVAGRVDDWGTVAIQDNIRSTNQAQSLITFRGANGTRVGYFGPSWGNFVFSNEAFAVQQGTPYNPNNRISLSPFGVTTVGGGPINFPNSGNVLQVYGTTYVQTSLGIGTTTPNAQLETRGAILSSSLVNNVGVYIASDEGNYGSIRATNSSGSDYKNLVLQEYNGNVSIGTNDPKGYKLAVNGGAIFTSAKVKLISNWPDYVFHQGYRIPSLGEVEAFIKQHKHLPGVPAASEVEANGLDLGETQAVLLKKIEELTLYVIETNKRLEAQQRVIDDQGKLIIQLQQPGKK